MASPEFLYSSAELRKVKMIQFGVLGVEEIRRMSVAEIKYERPYEDGRPKSEGIVDRRLGANGRDFPCLTCHCDEKNCPGHFGHIELAKPMFNSGFLNITLKILRCVCHYCSKLLGNPEVLKKARSIKNKGHRLKAVAKQCERKNCESCGHNQPKYTKDGFRIRMTLEDAAEDSAERKQTISAEKVYSIFKRMSDDDIEALGLSPRWSRPEWFIFLVLPVPPPQVRPSVMQGGMRNEDDLTNKLGDIVKNNTLLRNLEGTGSPAHVIREQVDLLQYHVATYTNNELPGVLPATVRGGGRPLKSLGQRFKGKHGRLRENLMGKRVDFSARTVITPDPNLKLDQVGVPYSIAKNLTYPETVTPYNFKEMQQLVINGPDEYPGAKYIERDDGRRINLEYVRDRSDLQLELGYKVVRHIRDGDFVLFNRQPSLHKMSIMGHRIKVMPYSTFRLNLSVTSPYNADFDGDEMNLHVAQTNQTRAEIMEIMMVPKCIVSPQAARPVMGIVQDTLLGCMLLTYRDTFLSRDLTMNLLMHVDDWDGVIPMPAILKPEPLWTGKQLFSLILPPVNLVRYSNTHPDDDNSPICPTDTKVYISRGELISGIVDKRTVGGGAAGGLVHVTWKEFGPERTCELISQIQVLVNHFVLQHGHSIGIGDTVADEATMRDVILTIREAKEDVKKLVRRAQEGELKPLPGQTMMQSFESEVNNVLNSARGSSGRSALKSLLRSNNFKKMVNAGSKGSDLNISQICACVGQQNVEGKRIGYGFRRRALPHFVLDDLGPESRGFVENSYLRGLTPTEFYFHAMGGREGLIDTACKTAQTGYIQRRLIKAMEDVMLKYDGTVRNGADQIIQFLYGEDGMDGSLVEQQSLRTLKMEDDYLEKIYLLDPVSIDFGRDLNGRPYLEQDIVENAQADVGLRQDLRSEFEAIREDRETLRREILRDGDNKKPLPVNIDRLIWNAKKDFNIRENSVSNLRPETVLQGVSILLSRCHVIGGLGDSVKVDDETVYGDEKIGGPDPLVQEAQANAIALFSIQVRATLSCKRVLMEHRLNRMAFTWLLGEIENRFLMAMCSPGEMVGALAAQSVGEPTTQMTLNTFHFAGVSEKNITIGGVPRFEELINVAKKLKGPSLKVYLTEECAQDEEKAKFVQANLEHTKLEDVTRFAEIYYDPDPKNTVIEADHGMVEDYYILEEDEGVNLSPWLLRLVLSKEVLTDRKISLAHIQQKINESFDGDLHVIPSEDNADELVLRLRIVTGPAQDKDHMDPELEEDIDQDDDSDDVFLRKVEADLLSQIHLGGIKSISKVYMRHLNRSVVDPNTGGYRPEQEWVLYTDGVNLLSVMSHDGVDFKRTASTDIVEIFEVLGIEAVRQALLNEVRDVMSTGGVSINYRHLSILCDVMTSRGHLMPITRHGINRADNGPLMKCSFEKTTDALLEAAYEAQHDELRGVSGCVVMGQLARMGTGSFGMVLNEELLKDAIEPQETDVTASMRMAQSPAGAEYEMNGGLSVQRPSSMRTPGREMTPGGRSYDSISTPIYGYSPAAWNTPNRGGVGPGQSAFQHSPIKAGTQFSPNQSSYGGNFTPGQSPGRDMVGPVSPGFGGSSPYRATSPHGGSSPYAASPGYSATSPAYGGGGAYSPTSPGYQATSPAGYAPTSPAHHYAPASPAVGAGGYSPTSPAYSPTSPAMNGYAPSSPAVGVGNQYSPSSPAYSPSSPSYGGGAAVTAGGNYSPTSPAYSPSSPQYSPTSPSFAPGGGSYSPASPTYNPGGAPQYSPSSPQYSPSSPSVVPPKS